MKTTRLSNGKANEDALAPAGAAASSPSRASPHPRTRRTACGVRRRPPIAERNTNARVSARRHCVRAGGQRLHELLELIRGPALERGAVALVCRDHRVAVVPVEPWLGVEPEGAPGLRGDR